MPSSTKLYLLTAAAPYTPATIRGAWNDTAGAVTRALSPQPSEGRAFAEVTRSETSATQPYSVLLYRGVSGPLEAQTISGTLDALLSCSQSFGGANFYWHIHVYVTQGDSDTPRGTLLNDYTESTNVWPSNFGSAVGHGLASAQSLSSLGVSAGDRIVVEIGYVSRNTETFGYSGRLNYGSSALGPTLTLGEVGAFYTGSLTFSSAIDYQQGPGRVTQAGTEAASHLTVYGRATQVGVEVAHQQPIPSRITQAGVEVLYTGGTGPAEILLEGDVLAIAIVEGLLVVPFFIVDAGPDQNITYPDCTTLTGSIIFL